jgi:excinuclease ABC subunit A
VLLDLGLGYLALDRSTPTLSPGELQRLRLATQVRSNLFGVVYVLDEPSAGLHPADTAALLRALDRLKASGNSIFVVEHELDVIRHADWIVDVGPEAGEHGGRILFSGPPADLARVTASHTRRYLFDEAPLAVRPRRVPERWLRLAGVTRNNVVDLDVAFPLGVLTSVTGISGSGKSSLVSQSLVELVPQQLGQPAVEEEEPTLLERVSPIPARRANRRGHGAHQPAGHGGPEADRPHAALEPRDLHGAVRPRPQAVRRDEGRGRGATTRGASRSTSRRDAARTARARAS